MIVFWAAADVILSISYAVHKLRAASARLETPPAGALAS